MTERSTKRLADLHTRTCSMAVWIALIVLAVVYLEANFHESQRSSPPPDQTSRPAFSEDE